MIPVYSRILVVDDSASIRKAVRTMLAQTGFVVVDEAADGAEALNLILSIRYALVISDWFMEPMSGIELLRSLRSRGRRLPFIMMTAQNQKKFAAVARDSGATHFLVKPFTARTLAETIATITYEAA